MIGDPCPCPILSIQHEIAKYIDIFFLFDFISINILPPLCRLLFLTTVVVANTYSWLFSILDVHIRPQRGSYKKDFGKFSLFWHLVCCMVLTDELT